MYPTVTLQMNAMGHVHIWQGQVNVVQVDKYNYHGDGREADVYFQVEYDIREIVNDLSRTERKDLNAGWTVYTRHITDEYFGEE